MTTGDRNILIGRGISADPANTGISPGGNRQLNIGNLLIGRMPASTIPQYSKN